MNDSSKLNVKAPIDFEALGLSLPSLSVNPTLAISES